jgi:hypothetical protein
MLTEFQVIAQVLQFFLAADSDPIEATGRDKTAP